MRELFKKIFCYDEEKESNRLKQKMCLAARKEALCNGNCSYCAWETKDFVLDKKILNFLKEASITQKKSMIDFIEFLKRNCNFDFQNLEDDGK